MFIIIIFTWEPIDSPLVTKAFVKNKKKRLTEYHDSKKLKKQLFIKRTARIYVFTAHP